MEYIGLLIKRGYVAEEALTIAQSQRDPPDHGIGLRPVQQREALVSQESEPDPAFRNVQLRPVGREPKP